MSETVVLITGAGKGIGKGLVERYLLFPNHTVIGTVRGAGKPQYQTLKDSPTGPGSRLILVSLDGNTLEDPARAVEQAKDASGITKIDIVIANAGMSPPVGPLEDATVSDISEALTVNTLSPIALYKATFPLLKASQRPRWLSVSSAAGSVGNVVPFSAHYLLAYGMSKAALNFFTLTIHSSQPSFIAYAIHPGLVQTDLGNRGAEMQGMEKAPTTVEESCSKIISSLESASREKTSGRFISIIEDEDIAW